MYLTGHDARAWRECISDAAQPSRPAALRGNAARAMRRRERFWYSPAHSLQKAGFMRQMLVTSLVLLAVAPAAAQSFDCSKAQSPVEKMICGDTGLRELDEHLGRYYAAARSELGSAASCLQSDQAQWLKATRGACRDAPCLRTAYLNRLAELDPLQPGASAIRNIELPAEAPALVWVIGPAADQVAAPPNARVSAFEGTGTILDETSGGDGFMFQLDGGEKLPLALLMFLEGRTGDQLAALAKIGNTSYRARGHLAFDGKRRFFEPSRCTFIHRVAPIDPDLQEMEKVRTRVVTQGKVCPDPAGPCDGFKPNELSFAIAQPFKFDRGRDRSQPFYAVILKSGPLCGINDSERVEAQKRFPAAKVFLHRHLCNDFGDKVTYSNINEKSGFLAVYAGETENEARKVVEAARAAGYAGANLRRMEVIVVYQLE